MKLLTPEEGRLLLKTIRTVIGRELGEQSALPVGEASVFDENAGTFVTLKLNNQLRGCIGNIEPVKSIRQSVLDNAISAAFHDHRFAPLTRQEFDEVEISLSVLGHAKPLLADKTADRCNALRPGKDGVILRCKGRSATFLPQVWEQLPDPQNFLSHLCIKAGLERDCWLNNDTEILVYQVQSFTEEKE
ncbi:MAG: AmmeMemoRadiSam system protein A [Desulfopila sp.]|jgi:AmmeMemoRadiSam system protein A|nr:AmmeMemoRadiSam system protein A [Desulfopila sp.]